MSKNGSLDRRKFINVILPMFFCSLMAYFDRLNISYAALTMNKDLGFSAEIYGFGAGILFLGYILFEIPGSIYASNRSPVKWIFRIMVTWGLACACMAFVFNAWSFYFVRFLIGAAEASFYPVCYSCLFPRFFNAKDRPKAISIMLTSLLVSSIIGSPMAGVLLGTHFFGLAGWKSLFLIQGIMAFLYSFIFIKWAKDKPDDCNWLTAEEKKMLNEEFIAENQAKTSAKHYTIWQALSDKTVIKLSCTYFFWVSGFWGFGFFLPTVLKKVSGLSNASVSYLIIIPMSIALIGFIVNGNHSSKTRETRWHMAIPMFIGAFGLLGGILTTHNPILSFVFICITCVGVYDGMGVWWTVPTSFLSGEAAAGATGMINSIGNIGGWIGPYIVGMSITRTGSNTVAFYIMTVSLIIAGCLMLTLPKENIAVKAIEKA